MPLSAPKTGRKPIHTRAIECSSFARDDGLWDIEGHLTDVKSYAFKNAFRGEIQAGEPLHDMRLRLTVDADFIVRDVEAVIDAGPFAVCPTITPAFKTLVGEKIGPGWNRLIRDKLGGPKGCNHLVDLLRPMATVAYHTVRWSDSAPGAQKAAKRRPPINSCHVWAADGDLVRTEFPEHYAPEDQG